MAAATEVAILPRRTSTGRSYFLSCTGTGCRPCQPKIALLRSHHRTPTRTSPTRPRRSCTLDEHPTCHHMNHMHRKFLFRLMCNRGARTRRMRSSDLSRRIRSSKWQDRTTRRSRMPRRQCCSSDRAGAADHQPALDLLPERIPKFRGGSVADQKLASSLQICLPCEAAALCHLVQSQARFALPERPLTSQRRVDTAVAAFHPRWQPQPPPGLDP